MILKDKYFYRFSERYSTRFITFNAEYCVFLGHLFNRQLSLQLTATFLNRLHFQGFLKKFFGGEYIGDKYYYTDKCAHKMLEKYDIIMYSIDIRNLVNRKIKGKYVN